MPQLDFTAPPFDVLTPAERQSLKKHSQVRYLDTNERLTEADQAYLFIVLKGNINHSEQTVEDHTKLTDKAIGKSAGKFIGDFHKNDWFRLNDNQTTQYQYTASNQTLLLQIDNSAVERISAQNHLIRQLLNGGLSDKMQALSNQSASKKAMGKQRQGEAQQLMLQPVTAISLLKLHIINDSDSIFSASKTMTQEGLKHVLVRRQNANERHPTKGNGTSGNNALKNIGMITDTDICRAISEGEDPATTPCSQYSTFNLQTIDHHQDISDALLIMMRYRVHRLPVVDDDGQIIGILGQTDLLSYISHHSQLITVQIEQATDIDTLHKAVDMIGKYIRTQQQNGIKVGVISRMVQALNAQVFAKLWRLIVPEIIFENTCVIVMGSEGRGEQIMRTDQDNALIIRNGFQDSNLPDYAETFNQALAKMGYPLCNGNIMMTNPLWRQSLNRFEKQISSWFGLKDPIYSVYLSAILDGAYVCGDERLLNTLREHLKIAHQNTNPMMIRQFARIALQYGEVNQWWQRFSLFNSKKGKDENAHDIDLKKAGIFPIVHGVRAMAMEHNIYHVTSTKARLKALARAGVISEKRAEDITETLHFFMAQRLAVSLTTEDKLARQVNPTTLSALERDLMKECLNIVKSYKNELTVRYQLQYGG